MGLRAFGRARLLPSQEIRSAHRLGGSAGASPSRKHTDVPKTHRRRGNTQTSRKRTDVPEIQDHPGIRQPSRDHGNGPMCRPSSALQQRGDTPDRRQLRTRGGAESVRRARPARADRPGEPTDRGWNGICKQAAHLAFAAVAALGLAAGPMSADTADPPAPPRLRLPPPRPSATVHGPGSGPFFGQSALPGEEAQAENMVLPPLEAPAFCGDATDRASLRRSHRFYSRRGSPGPVVAIDHGRSH